jgi:predicted ATPase
MLYRFDARHIADAAYSGEEHPTVEEDGGNTAVVLAALKLEQEEAFERIEEELRKIVPSVQRIRVKRVKMPPHSPENPTAEARVGHKVFLDFKGAWDVPAHAASEGTLITLALLTALCSPKRPRLLLLDDIDHSLHPQAQMHLMRELKRLLAEFPDVQLVATTHSPYILDELEPSDVRVFALRPDGSVACRSLSEHPQAEKTRGVLSSGQLWSLDPEWRWVVGEG